MLRAELEAGRGNYAAAEAEIEQSRREQQASLSWTAQASWALARLDVRGKLARAAQHGRDYMAESEQRDLPGQYLEGAIALAWLDLVDAALTRHLLPTIPALDRPYTSLAAFFARAGRLERAKHLLAEFETNVAEGIRRRDFLRYAAAGEVALAERRA